MKGRVIGNMYNLARQKKIAFLEQEKCKDTATLKKKKKKKEHNENIIKIKGNHKQTQYE